MNMNVFFAITITFRVCVNRIEVYYIHVNRIEKDNICL